MNRQEAQGILWKLRDKNSEARRPAAVSQLPEQLRVTTWHLLGYNEHGQPHPYGDWAARNNEYWAAVHKLEAMPETDRLSIFEGLLPQLGAYVEAGWQLQKRLPYQVGGPRRAFRVAQRPELTLHRRSHWLSGLIGVTSGYEAQNLTWWAQWAGYLWNSQGLGILFAAAIDQGDTIGDEIFDILVASAKGEHEIGIMGHHVTQGLLITSRPEGWRFIEQLLIAAQRQEGLRQVVLETIDEAHPEAFRRMVQLIREQNLTRFSSVVRAVNVWFGLNWEATDTRAVQQTINHLDDWLTDGTACLAALEADDPQRVYLALCVLAFTDADHASEQAKKLLAHPQLEHRFVATHFLAYVGLPGLREALLSMLADKDLRVIVTALRRLLQEAQDPDSLASVVPELFERLEALLPCFPVQKKILEPLVWPWSILSAEQQEIADRLYAFLGERPLGRLRPYINLMSSYTRMSLAHSLLTRHSNDPATRDILLQLLGDRSSGVRQAAIEVMAKVKLDEAEIQQLESYLTRKAGDLRRGILGLLLGQGDDTAILACAHRLLEEPHPLQRQAGLELLRQLTEQERLVSQAQAMAEAYLEKHPQLSESEQKLLEPILKQPEAVATLEDGLGLFDPTLRTSPLTPQAKMELLYEGSLISPAALACIQSMDALIHSQRETMIRFTSQHGKVEAPLGNMGYFPYSKDELEQDIRHPPLHEIWEAWWAERPAALRDQGGLELVRALAVLERGHRYGPRYWRDHEPEWLSSVTKSLYGQIDIGTLGYPHLIEGIFWWFIWLHPPTGAVDFLLDAVEHMFSLIPAVPHKEPDWRQNRQLLKWLFLARKHRSSFPDLWLDAHHVRLWRLLRWLDEPGPGIKRYRPELDEVMQAYLAGGATQADLLDQFLGFRGEARSWEFKDLHVLNGRKPHRYRTKFAEHPELQTLAEQCRRRIIEVELKRGDIPTAASIPALALRFSGSMETLLPLLAALGQEKFVRGWSYDGLSKQAVFSYLIQITYPAEGDTPEQFAAQVQQLSISQSRLIETAVFAPQWAAHVEHTLGWPEFAEAVWWLHAHTKDRHWRIEDSIRERWQAETSERTPLTGQDLLDGAVDVAWFQRVYTTLGETRWGKLDEAAKYTSGGGGHRRAQLFAEAMLGQIDQDTLANRLSSKRHQDAVRALGLLPLPADATRETIILERYKLIQEFIRGSRKFGSQRQANEKLAARIGLENLARTAGYPDLLRLEWAMESQAVADLAAGPMTVQADGVAVTLTIDDWGEPQLRVTKNDRVLKAVPAHLKKQPDITILLTRKQEIKQQGSRVRQSLELAMCRGDRFTHEELQRLLRHPVLKPMLSQLVFIDETASIIGYPVDEGQALAGINQKLQAVLPEMSLRLAHPYDLLQTGEWHIWQQECFRHEYIQPFKQVFRELYVLTAAEKAEKIISRRYAGHQVNPRQAVALLGQRGWVGHPEEGVRRTFHEEKIIVGLTCQRGYFTPAEVEGLTLEGVVFGRRDELGPMLLEQVPPRLFSEAMRDLDLVVSVAHQGGVDPEATASTVEMRAALVRETCALLKVDNIRLNGNYVFIDGALNHYSLHLGSGTVHQQPGGYLCIVPVHSQHRGRIFLPFADDDPKTAEVIAKVLLLARDKEIKDPLILEQIAGPRR